MKSDATFSFTACLSNFIQLRLLLGEFSDLRREMFSQNQVGRGQANGGITPGWDS